MKWNFNDFLNIYVTPFIIRSGKNIVPTIIFAIYNGFSAMLALLSFYFYRDKQTIQSSKQTKSHLYFQISLMNDSVYQNFNFRCLFFFVNEINWCCMTWDWTGIERPFTLFFSSFFFTTNDSFAVAWTRDLIPGIMTSCLFDERSFRE